MPTQENDDPSRDDIYFYGPPRADERFISYTLNPEERPGGMKVRYVLKVVSGDRAKEIDARQAVAIYELLQWAREHREQQEHDQQDQQPIPPARPARAPQAPVNAPDK